MSGGQLEADPVFLGLVRPTTIFGVHFMFVMINLLACVVAFIQTKNFVILFVLLPILHGLAYLICLKDIRMIELVSMRYGKFSRCKNRTYHKFTNSYDLF